MKRTTTAKVYLFNLIACSLTLLICPQFGWNPFNVVSHLPHIFMQYGLWTCGLMCGMIFMSFGAIATYIALDKNEMAYFGAKGYIHSYGFTSIVVFVLMLFGKSASGLDVYFTLTFISFWILGAFSVNWGFSRIINLRLNYN